MLAAPNRRALNNAPQLGRSNSINRGLALYITPSTLARVDHARRTPLTFVKGRGSFDRASTEIGPSLRIVNDRGGTDYTGIDVKQGRPSLSGPFTMMFYGRPSSFTSSGVQITGLISAFTAQGSNGPVLRWGNDGNSGTARRIVAYAQIGGVDKTLIADTDSVAGVDYLFIATYDGATFSLWCNGVMLKSVAASGAVTVGAYGKLTIGADYVNDYNTTSNYGNRHFAGDIYAVGIWERGFTFDEARSFTAQQPLRSPSASLPLWTLKQATPSGPLTASPSAVRPTLSSGSITQTHQLVAAGLLSQVASAVSALVQVHQVAAAASVARPVSTAVAIAQTHLPLAIASQVPTTSLGSAIGQTHLAASQAQSSTPTSAGASIAQAHVLVGVPMLAQPLARDVAISIPGALAAEALAVRPTSPAAAISQQHRVASVAQAAVPQSPAAAMTQAHQLASLPMAATPASATASLGAVAMLGAVPMAAQPTMTAAGITQTHALIAAPASSLAMVSAVAIVQTHILAAALSVVRPRSYDVSLPPEYVLPAPDARRMFIPGRAPMRYPAPQRAMTLSAGASMQDLGKFEIAPGERLDFDIAITEELRGEAASMVTAGGSASGITVDPTPIVTGGVMKVWATAADAAVRGQRATIAVSFSTASGLRRRGSFVLKVA